jgi:phenylpyruvate tautomerase PptA (4-oxalocrotonate tautomerase family)
VEFTEVRPGLWFTAGEPSTASMVLGSVPSGTPQALRVEVMDAVARMFSEATGSDYEHVMVVAADARPTA